MRLGEHKPLEEEERKKPGGRRPRCWPGSSGDGTLSLYYSNLARAFAGLGKTREAVDAAAGAIVSWGCRQDQRTQALKSLQEILAASRDLDAYAALVEREAASGPSQEPRATLEEAMLFQDPQRIDQDRRLVYTGNIQHAGLLAVHRIRLGRGQQYQELGQAPGDQ